MEKTIEFAVYLGFEKTTKNSDYCMDYILRYNEYTYYLFVDMFSIQFQTTIVNIKFFDSERIFGDDNCKEFLKAKFLIKCRKKKIDKILNG